VGFKVIETEEEIRSAFSAGLMWWKADGYAQFHREDTGFGINVTLGAWRNRAYRDDPSHMSWEAYVLVEDEDD
jgi:hypothetical protein